MQLAQESSRATELLQGKVVTRVIRHKETEVLVEFADATRLFVGRSPRGVELSITGASEGSASLSPRQAYLAMFAFLESQLRSTSSDDIAALLGSLALLPDGSPADPACAVEWQAAVDAALAGNVESEFNSGS